jgi:hypothetical protein
MPRVGFESTIPVLERAKTFRALDQRSPTDGSRENFGGPWRNLDIICNFYVYYTVSLYSDSSCHRHRIADNFRLIALHQIHVLRTTTIALTLFIVVFV